MPIRIRAFRSCEPATKGGLAAVPAYPARNEIGGVGPGPGRLLQIVVGAEPFQLLVRRGEGVMEGTRVVLIDAGVRGRVDNEGGQRDPGEVRRRRALRGAQAPHRQPGPQRAGPELGAERRPAGGVVRVKRRVD
jgi:hypothetical protein